MKRRLFMQGAATALAVSTFSPSAFAQMGSPDRLRFAPAEGLAILDPHFTTIHTTNNYGHYVYDTLYSVDASYKAQPQMVESHTVSDDNLTWDLKLRPGLKFHDGEPVRAQDCIASMKRWGQRNTLGLTLFGYIEELTAPDDQSIRIRLKSPFGVVPDVLATPVASACVIMPERIAATPITEQVTESIGSGPYRFVASEFVPGQRAVFEKFEDYVPRSEPASGTSGGKVAHFQTIEWNKIADQATSTAAIQSGEVDWIESVNLDLLEILKLNPAVSVSESDSGIRNWMRFNMSNSPFKDNPALRRAVASAIDQQLFTQALMGATPVPTCYSMYSCILEGVPQLGESLMGGPKDYEAIAAKIKEAGYNGEKIVILSAGEIPTTAPMGPVLLDVLQKIGMNAELQSMDINTYVSRRAMTEPVEEGGWSIFLMLINTPLMINPLSPPYARGLGTKGYPGNYDDPTLEEYIAAWIAADDAARPAALDKIQERLWDQVPAVPLANYSTYTALRADLTGRVPFLIPLPWGLQRA